MMKARISQLDELRGLACLIVTVLHCLVITIPDEAGTLAHLVVGIPKIGVWLFFSLSAFLLTLHFIDSEGRTEPIGWYFTKRLLRVGPAFAVALFIYHATGIVPLREWVRASRGEESASILHLWTIPVEVSFYLILPFVLVLAGACRRRFGPTSALAPILLAIILCTIAWPPAASPAGSLWVGWYAVNFLSGAVAATLCQMEHPNHPRQRDAWSGMGAALLIVAIVVASKVNLIGTGRTWLIDKQCFRPVVVGRHLRHLQAVGLRRQAVVVTQHRQLVLFNLSVPLACGSGSSNSASSRVCLSLRAGGINSGRRPWLAFHRKAFLSGPRIDAQTCRPNRSMRMLPTSRAFIGLMEGVRTFQFAADFTADITSSA